MKVLIISHNPISTNNNMGKTLLSLFSSFENDELCQLYVYPVIPDVDICNSYYRITDRAVLNSYVNPHNPGGIVNKDLICFDQIQRSGDKAFNSSNNAPIKRLLRDAMWSMSRWYSKDLRKWLDQETPDCIFLAPGYAKFIYDIALKISRIRKIPIVTYICDDYYFVIPPRAFAGKFQHKLLQKKIKQLMKKTSHIISISSEIKNTYSLEFSVDTSVIMTGAELNIDQESNYFTTNDKCVCSYFGNLGLNRDKSLCDIGMALDRISKLYGVEAELRIYTSEVSAEKIRMFDNVSSIKICGFVSGDEFVNAVKESDVLVHVEGFDEESMDLVKYSVSTKIADSLASGIPLLAYGPKQIASIQYLCQNDCAYIASSADELESELVDVLINKFKKDDILIKAKNIASLNHDKVRNSLKLKDILKKVCDCYE